MIPKIGDVIYIHPSDEHCGGKAIVSSCTCNEIDDLFVQVEQCNTSYNWKFLEKEQNKLKERYQNEWSCSDSPNNIRQYSLEDLQEEINRRLSLDKQENTDV